MDSLIRNVKLFGKYSFEGVECLDISLIDYISVTNRGCCYTPHTSGRWNKKRFRKSQCPIVERLVNSLMMHGRNNGKKIKAIRILHDTMDIIHLATGENPIKVVVDAVAKGGCREDSTRIGSGGIVRRQAVDVSPLRRVNQAVYLITQGARQASFRSTKTMAECLADEIMLCAKESSSSHAIRKKDEIERVAKGTSVQCIFEIVFDYVYYMSDKNEKDVDEQDNGTNTAKLDNFNHKSKQRSLNTVKLVNFFTKLVYENIDSFKFDLDILHSFIYLIIYCLVCFNVENNMQLKKYRSDLSFAVIAIYFSKEVEIAQSLFKLIKQFNENTSNKKIYVKTGHNLATVRNYCTNNNAKLIQEVINYGVTMNYQIFDTDNIIDNVSFDTEKTISSEGKKNEKTFEYSTVYINQCADYINNKLSNENGTNMTKNEVREQIKQHFNQYGVKTILFAYNIKNFLKARIWNTTIDNALKSVAIMLQFDSMHYYAISIYIFEDFVFNSVAINNMLNISSDIERIQKLFNNIVSEADTAWYKKKKVKIAAVAAGIGTLSAITAGLAAPILAGGLATLGVTSTSAFLTSTGGAASIASLFGAGGAGLSSWKYAKRLTRIRHFKLHPLITHKKVLNNTLYKIIKNTTHKYNELNNSYCLSPDDSVNDVDCNLTVTRNNDELHSNTYNYISSSNISVSCDKPDEESICISADDVTKSEDQNECKADSKKQSTDPTDEHLTDKLKKELESVTFDFSNDNNIIIHINGFLHKKYVHISMKKIYGQIISYTPYVLVWEPKLLTEMGSQIIKIVSENIVSQAAAISIQLTMQSTAGLIMWPVAFMQYAAQLDNTWMMSKEKAQQAGKNLAVGLMLACSKSCKNISLVGFSMGARVILYCLKELHKQNCFNIIDNVIMMGLPHTIDIKLFTSIRTVVNGKLINVYSRTDLVLALMFRWMEWRLNVAGLSEIALEGYTNLDATHIINSHYDYIDHIQEILEICELENLLFVN